MIPGAVGHNYSGDHYSAPHASRSQVARIPERQSCQVNIAHPEVGRAGGEIKCPRSMRRRAGAREVLLGNNQGGDSSPPARQPSNVASGSRGWDRHPILNWLSPRTARLKGRRQRWLPWCGILRSSLGKPRGRSIHLRPLLGFKREPRPGPCDVDKNISDSGTRRVFRHHSAFGGSIPAYFRREHGQSRKAPLAFPKENPPRPGGPAGFIAWQVWGFGVSAKLAYQSKTDLNVPRFSRPYVIFHGYFYSWSC